MQSSTPTVQPCLDHPNGSTSAQDLDVSLNYWIDHLAGIPAVLELPTDHARPALPSNDRQSLSWSLPQTLIDQLQLMKPDPTLPLATLFCTAWIILLYRYTHQSDLVIGSILSDFNSREYSNQPAQTDSFLYFLPIRSQLNDEMSFSDLSMTTHHLIQQAQSHDNFDLITVLHTLGLSADPSYHPIFQVGFQCNLDYDRGSANFNGSGPSLDLVLSIQTLASAAPNSQSDQLQASFIYDPYLFNPATIQRMIGHFQTLLTAITTNSNQRISDLPLLTDQEHQRILIEWTRTQTDYPQTARIDQLFQQQAAQTPQATAITFQTQCLTYQDLDQQSNQLAHALQALGVGPDCLVGVYLDRSLSLITTLLGILKAGGAYVPLDPAYPQERLATILTDAQVTVLITDQQKRENLPDLTHSSTRLLCLDTEAPTWTTKSTNPPVTKATADHLAYVMYTSGSTGQPKGVCVIHRGVVRLVRNTNYARFDPDQVFLQLAPIAFDASTLEIWGPLLNGGQLVLMPSATPTLAELGAAIQTHQITTLWLTAGLFHLMVDERLEDLSPLKQLIAGGDVLSVPHVQKVLKTLPHCQLINGYGPTENTTFTCCYPLSPADPMDRSIPIGHAIANTYVYILDHHLQPVPIGIPGELYIGGDGLARGYLNRPDLTAERFIQDPFSSDPQARLYKTGDRVRWREDGAIEFLGRIDFQVKIRGFRIELGEIESVLVQHPAIRTAVVLAREDQPGDKRLVAYLAFQEVTLTSAVLRQYLKRKLPDYMIPSAFVTLDQFPLNANGKVDRRALTAPALSPRDLERTLVSPRTPIESILASIWADVLGVEVGIQDPFAELGGHSLQATRIVSRLRDVLSVDLPVHAVLKAGTIAELARWVESARYQTDPHTQIPPLEAGSRPDQLPLSFYQERLWLLEEKTLNSPIHNLPMAFRIQGSLQIPALEQAINTILERHESLRTTFPIVQGSPIQQITPRLVLSLPIEPVPLDPNLISMDANGSYLTGSLHPQEALLHQLVNQEAQKPFDLKQGPLIRIRLFHLAADDHVLVITPHHIVTDGWSLGILMQELSILYTAYTQGSPSPLPPPPLQYADFSLWHRQWLQQPEVYTNLVNYWTQQLATAPPLLELPTDHPRPNLQTFRGQILAFEIESDLTEALKHLSGRAGSTLFMTLLTAFSILLHRYSGQHEVVVGSPVANRNHTEIESTIGCFPNIVALRTSLHGDPEFLKLLDQVRQTALEAYAHQDFPVEQLLANLQSARDLSYSPWFQVVFILLNVPMTDLQLPDLTVTRVPIEKGTALFDLTLLLWETSSGLEGTIEFNTDLFEASTIQRLIDHFHILLQGIVANPDQRISTLPLLTEAERDQILYGWNETTTDYPRHACIHHLFAQQADQTPEAIAVKQGSQAITYRDLDHRANQLAHQLQTLGIRSESLIGVYLDRSLDLITALLGILKAGAAYVPLDLAYPPERIQFMVEDAQLTLLITQTQLLDRLPDPLPGIPILCLDHEAAQMGSYPTDPPSNSGTANDLAYVMYTSGSTGQPKGVCIPHRGVVRLVKNCNYVDLGPDQVILQMAPVAFDAATFEIWGALLNGSCLVLMPGSSPSLQTIGQVIQQEQITTLWLTAGLFDLMVQERFQDLKSLRQLLAGGDVLSVPHVQKVLHDLPHCQLINGYGPSENTTFTCCYPIQDPNMIERTIPIGRPIANTQVYILDPQLQPVPIGVIGELYAGGDGLARGYLNRSDLTQAAFIPNPFSSDPESRLYKTGDRVRWRSDGTIEFLGRIDYQIKLRGYRIELGEIETTILQDRSIQSAVVMARSDHSEDLQLVAYIVPKSEAFDPVALHRFLQQKLPDYMLPSAFVVLKSLPLTPNGKVDRRALPVPDPATSFETTHHHVPARDPLEQQLIRLWESVLRVRPIGIRDHFFDLGGHSLLAMQLLNRIQTTLNQELSLAALLQVPTIELLADRLRRQGWELTQSPIIPIQPSGSKSPFFFINSLSYLRILAPLLGSDQPVYGLSIFGLPPLDTDQLNHLDIKTLAAPLVKALQAIQPEGPYYLGAYCGDTILTLEIAQQLRSQNQVVKSLILIDGVWQPSSFKTKWQSIRHNVQQFGMAYIIQKLMHKLDERSQSLNAIIQDGQRMVNSWIHPEQKRFRIALSQDRKLYQAFLKASQAYEPQPYPGPIVLLLSSEWELSDLSLLRYVAADQLSIQVIPGYHYTMFKQPQIQILVQALQQHLET